MEAHNPGWRHPILSIFRGRALCTSSLREAHPRAVASVSSSSPPRLRRPVASLRSTAASPSPRLLLRTCRRRTHLRLDVYLTPNRLLTSPGPYPRAASSLVLCSLLAIDDHIRVVSCWLSFSSSFLHLSLSLSPLLPRVSPLLRFSRWLDL